MPKHKPLQAPDRVSAEEGGAQPASAEKAVQLFPQILFKEVKLMARKATAKKLRCIASHALRRSYGAEQVRRPVPSHRGRMVNL